MRYKVAPGVIVDKVADEIALTLGNGDVIVLNRSAAAVMDCATHEGVDVRAIAERLISEGFLAASSAERNVRICLARLRGCGALVPDGRSASSHKWDLKRPILSRRAFITAASLGSILPIASVYADETVNQASTTKMGEWAEEASDAPTRLWSDPRGFKIALPSTIQKVAPIGAFAHSIMETIDSSMIVHVTSFGLRASTEENREALAEELNESSGSCLCEYAVETEEPDILLSIVPSESRLAQNDMASQNEAGVPIVHMLVGIEDIPEAYETLAVLLGKERALDIADYMRDISETLEAVRASVPSENRSRVYLGMGALGLETRGKDTLVGAMLEFAGVINVAENYTEGDVVTSELASSWSPDLALLCPGGSSYERNIELGKDSLWKEGAFSPSCTVVAEPLVPYGWLDRSPLVIGTIGALWVASLAYPELFGLDIEEIAVDYWNYLFGLNLNSQDLALTSETAQQTVDELRLAAINGDTSTTTEEIISNSEEEGTSSIPSKELESPSVEIISAQAIASAYAYMSSSGGSSGGGSGGSSSGSSSSGSTTQTATKFKNALKNHFGFKEDIASLLHSVLCGVESLCSSVTTNKDLYIAYIFFRLIGAFNYGNEDWRDSLEWNTIAGSIDNIYDCSLIGVSSTTANEQDFFVSVLNLSESQYKKLRYEVRLQHVLSGDTAESQRANIKNDEEYFSNCVDSYTNAYGLNNISDDDFESIWNEYLSQYSVMPDFSHFCITTATHLASDLEIVLAGDVAVGILYAAASIYLGGSNEARESLAGWLGDAVISEGYQGPSFGWDDFWADIDALRIAKTLPDYSYDVRRVLTNYYPTTASYFNRRLYFLRYFTTDDVALAISSILSDVLLFTAEELADYLEGKSRYEATLRFVKVLMNEQEEGIYHGSDI